MVGFNNDILPVDYVLEKFYHYAGKPKKIGNKYNASCPICREGKSWLKKKRLYYYPSSNSLYCHNCQGSWSALWWIKEVSGMDPKTIVKEAKSQYGDEVGDGFFRKVVKEETPWVTPDLPLDAINLFDSQEIDFYKSNKKVQAALQYVKDRKLDTAINKPKAIYFSLKDRMHKNRILFPFYDESGRKILFYQTRLLFKTDNDSAKYISKFNAEKTICGINNVKPEIPYIFIFEGPVDSFFVRNAVAMAGVQYTEKQNQQLQSLDGFYHRIWVLDNPIQDQNEEVRDKIIELIDRSEAVFIWPKELAKYKDINELCVDKQLNEIPYQLLVKFAKKGNEAKLALAMCN
jgi:hypothetical protein